MSVELVMLSNQVSHSNMTLLLVPHEISVFILFLLLVLGFPHNSVGKSSACKAGDPDSIPGSRKSPGEGNGKPPQYSCLENPMDRGTWQATVHGVTKSQTRQEQLSNSEPSGAEWRGAQLFF